MIRELRLPCDPVVENVRFDGEPDVNASKRLKTLFDEDQRYAAEPVDWTDPEKVLREIEQSLYNKRMIKHDIVVLKY